MQLMFDRAMMQQMLGDLSNDVRSIRPTDQLVLYGNTPCDTPVPTDQILAFIERSKKDTTPLWELQWAMLTVLYVSDKFVEYVRKSTHPAQMSAWYDGNGTGDAFRTRYEGHVVGKFGKKAAKGSRKMVTCIALHPLDAVVHEVLMMHAVR
jgi:hypothetical protein